MPSPSKQVEREYVETIAERFGLTALEDARKLNGFADGKSDDDDALLDCICVLEEMEGNAAGLRHTLEKARPDSSEGGRGQ